MWYARIDSLGGDVVIEKDYPGSLVLGSGETPEEARAAALNTLQAFIESAKKAEVVLESV